MISPKGASSRGLGLPEEDVSPHSFRHMVTTQLVHDPETKLVLALAESLIALKVSTGKIWTLQHREIESI